MPKLTIGLPVYNSGRTLKVAIQSVLDQTFTDWELLICDDASTDGSFELAQAIGDPRIRVVRNSENGGLSVALNRIVELARAPFIARMDSDDLMHPERMEKQLAVFERDPSVEVTSTDAYVIDDDNRVLGGRRRGLIATTSAEVLWHNGPIHASMLARKSWCERFPYLAEFRRGEDLDLWARAMPVSVHRHVSERLYFIRENPNVSVEKYCRTIAAHSMVFRKFAGDVPHTTVAALLLRSSVRMGAYRAAGMLGLQSRIAARRVENIDDRELAKAQAVVDDICLAAKCREDAVCAIR